MYYRNVLITVGHPVHNVHHQYILSYMVYARTYAVVDRYRVFRKSGNNTCSTRTTDGVRARAKLRSRTTPYALRTHCAARDVSPCSWCNMCIRAYYII